MIRSLIALCAFAASLLASPVASAAYYRFYTEGEGTLVRDGLGLFGPSLTDASRTRVGFTRSILEFEVPTPVLSGWPLHSIDDGYLRVALWGRSFESAFSTATLLTGTSPGALDTLVADLDLGPDLRGTLGFSFGPGPLSSNPTQTPTGTFALKIWNSDLDLTTELFVWDSARAATRLIPDAFTTLAAPMLVPAPATGWLLTAGLGLLFVSRTRRGIGTGA